MEEELIFSISISLFFWVIGFIAWQIMVPGSTYRCYSWDRLVRKSKER